MKKMKDNADNQWAISILAFVDNIASNVGTVKWRLEKLVEILRKKRNDDCCR